MSTPSKQDTNKEEKQCTMQQLHVTRGDGGAGDKHVYKLSVDIPPPCPGGDG